MGSRIRSNPDHLFECFCEVGQSKADTSSAIILQKYPQDYNCAEVLKSVPRFAYPCNFNVETVTHFSFVLTNIDSKWTFGFCRHAPNSQTCFVMLSYLPWHGTFFKILNQCSDLANRQASYLFKFLDALYLCEVPQPGLQLSVTYCTDTKVYEFEAACPDHLKILSIPEDRNLTEYFNAIDATNMIRIFANMLNERRILITSKNLCRLSSCVQAANSLIYPMHWQHIFIPVLPNHLLDYLSAPMPFLIGVPATTMNRVSRSELGDIVILDADENRIESLFDDVQMLPTDIIQSLKKSLKNPISMLGDGVARAFLRALVMLIGGYREALKFTPGQKITFNYDAFVATRPPSIQPFLTKMLQLQIFQQFIEGRLEMLNSGEGFSDEFEFELNMYEDKGAHRLKTQYKEWLGAMRKEGGAILKSVNPVVKSAYRQVKDKSKRAYKDLRSKIQNNTHEKSPSSGGGYRPSSEPSSPTLGSRISMKKSGSGSVIAKTDKTVTYVRERRPDSNQLKNCIETRHQNGFLSTSVSSSQSFNKLAPEASPELSDVESDHSQRDSIKRIDIDLMGELKEFLDKRNSIEELSFDESSFSKSTSSFASFSSNNNNNFNNSINSNSGIKPLPPPRPKVNRKSLGLVNTEPNNNINFKEVPLIQLDTPSGEDKCNDIFDPLFEVKKQTSNERPSLILIEKLDNKNLFLKNDSSINKPVKMIHSNPFKSIGATFNNDAYPSGQHHTTASTCQATSALSKPLPSLSVTNTNQSLEHRTQATTERDAFGDMILWASRLTNDVDLVGPGQSHGPLPRAVPSSSTSSVSLVSGPTDAGSNQLKANWQLFE